jgi:transcriptional regulator with XRE-family HTH domain
MVRVNIGDLVIRQDLFIRFGLNEDAIQRYMDLYRSGREKAIKVQAGTNVIIDGFHRIEASKRLGLKKILVEYVEAHDKDLRALAYKYNMPHGLPPTREERNRLIINLYFKDGWTQQQIADLTRLDRSLISKIISDVKIHNTNINVEEVDKRRELKSEDYPVIARLILSGEKQSSIAERFGVSQGRISQVWAEFRDRVYKFYTEERLLKREVAEKVGLTIDEADRILQQYGDPLNFEVLASTWWPAFGLDGRFGAPHASNLPADLVRNILALYTKPGDVILDPAAGGGVVLDVAKDMVNRRCYAYDLRPVRPDIKAHNLLVGSPPVPEKPDLIFFDPPYGPQKKTEYTASSEDLANMPIPKFLDSLSKIFCYWDFGVLVVLMSSNRGSEGFIDLPYETEKRMVEAGWRIIEHIVNQHGHSTKSEKGFWIAKAKRERWLLRRHIHILVGEK